MFISQLCNSALCCLHTLWRQTLMSAFLRGNRLQLNDGAAQPGSACLGVWSLWRRDRGAGVFSDFVRQVPVPPFRSNGGTSAGGRSLFFLLTQRGPIPEGPGLAITLWRIPPQFFRIPYGFAHSYRTASWIKTSPISSTDVAWCALAF